jgi:lipoprotein-releasing system permease protein
MALTRNSVEFWLARRFLTGKKRNTFLSFISLVSLFGVALGVAALVTVMGVMEGFESELRSIITSTRSHIVLYSSRSVIQDHKALEARIRRIAPEIEAVSPFVFSEVMLANGPRVVGSLMEGIDREREEATTQVAKHIMKGEFPEGGSDPTIVIASVLAEKLKVNLGDKVSVISPFFEEDQLRPRSKTFRVAGILSTGMYDYDSKYSLVDAGVAREFFKLKPEEASSFKIRTHDPNTSIRTAQKLKQELGYPYSARDWTELNRNLLYAIRLQKAVIFVILTAIIIVAAFNIMSTLVMMMSEKKREMSILKAMGLSPRRAATVYMTVGGIIGVSGAVAGVALGGLLSGILAKTRFIHLPPDVYFISYLPVDVRMDTLLVVFACATAIALFATVYPSWQVAVQSPVEGLRYE